MCFEGLARLSRRVWRRFVRGSREISLVPSLHRASTDALIYISHFLFLCCTCVGQWSVQEPLSPRLATGQSPAGHWSTLPASLLSSFSLSSFSCIAPCLVCISIIIIIIIIISAAGCVRARAPPPSCCPVSKPHALLRRAGQTGDPSAGRRDVG